MARITVVIFLLSTVFGVDAGMLVLPSFLSCATFTRFGLSYLSRKHFEQVFPGFKYAHKERFVLQLVVVASGIQWGGGGGGGRGWEGGGGV